MNSYARNKVLGGLAALLLFPAAGAWAQAGGAGAPTKVAIVNLQQAIVATGEGKAASAQLNLQFTPRQTELENDQRQIQDLQSRLNNGARTLSDDEKARLQRQGESMARQFQRKQDDMNEDVQAAQGEIVDTIGRKMFDVVDRYARENGFSVVLNSSAQGTPVLYASSQIDITQEIVRLYDLAYPMKAGTTSSTAPAPAPAPRRTAPSASPSK